MVTIVTHVEKGGRYVLLGASFSKWKTSRGSALGGNLFPVEEEGDTRVLAVSGADGIVRWVESKQFRVLEVDGVPLADAVREPG